MANTLAYSDSQHTFADIFNSTFKSGEEDVLLTSIVIPKIQRDYAQGRSTLEAVRVRNKFLDALYDAVEGTPITLDFVYGNIDKNGVLTPLDGQQRLTTLFLLHWFAAKKEHIQESEYFFLRGFSYENRPATRDFCHKLLSFAPSFSVSLSSEIIDQNWFPLDWKQDPTIDSMLTMLDAIQTKFFDVENLWDKLKSGQISFFFLPIKDMGLTDEIYIKMNSRGKPLTQFEHFKAEFEHSLEKVNKSACKRVINKIDREWTDLLWPYRGENNIVDDEFLRYFRFICDILCYKKNGSPKITDEFDLVKEYFSGEDAIKNLTLLESYFDCWLKIKKDELPFTEFFESLMGHTHQTGKITVEKRYEIDVFNDCLRNYGELISGRNRKFPLNRTVLLYAFITYLIHKEEVPEEEFRLRLRHIYNLIQNSTDEISDSESRVGGNRMPAIIKHVEHIILTGEIHSDEGLSINFNANQISEEREKVIWLQNNADKAEVLFKIEDHPLLHGQIGIIGLDNIGLAPKFQSLFNCDWDLVNCAMLAIGNYGQQESNNWRWQFGSKNESSWEFLFHMGAAKNFESTKSVLLQLLTKAKAFNDDYLRSIKDEYIAKCENDSLYDWRYYWLKYDSFRDTKFGKYYFEAYSLDEPYRTVLMKTRSSVSESSIVPYLFEIDSEHISRDDYGRSLIYEEFYVKNLNNAFEFYSNYDNSSLEKVPIPQTNNIDTVNRIKFGKEALAAFQNKLHEPHPELN